MDQMASVMGAAYVSCALVAAACGWLSDRWIVGGATPTLVRKGFTSVGMAGAAVFAVPCVLAGPRLATVMVVLMAASLGVCSSNVWAITQTLAGPRAAGRWTGIQNFVGNVGGAVAPALTAWIFCFSLLALSFFARSLSAQSSSADWLLLNAHVVTMNDKQPSAQAITIQGDRIAWVGSTDEAKRLYPKPARTVDLHGAMILPGIIDAHTHLINLGESLVRLNLKDIPTEKEIVERVKQRAASAVRGEWILGWGWDEGKWASNYPTNQALSAATPNHPVFLVGLHTFAAWANQRALEIAGVNKDTPDPTFHR